VSAPIGRDTRHPHLAAPLAPLSDRDTGSAPTTYRLQLHLRAPSEAVVVRALRAALKLLLRTFGVRVTHVSLVADLGAQAPSSAGVR
jgi:hypothetical protein